MTVGNELLQLLHFTVRGMFGLPPRPAILPARPSILPARPAIVPPRHAIVPTRPAIQPAVLPTRLAIPPPRPANIPTRPAILRQRPRPRLEALRRQEAMIELWMNAREEVEEVVLTKERRQNWWENYCTYWKKHRKQKDQNAPKRRELKRGDFPLRLVRRVKRWWNKRREGRINRENIHSDAGNTDGNVSPGFDV